MRLPELPSALIELVYPISCISCQQRHAPEQASPWLCAHCLRTFRYMPPPYCDRCGRTCQTPHSRMCVTCQGLHPPFRHGFVAYQYTDAIRACLHALKFNSHQPLGEWLGALLGRLAHAHMRSHTYDLIVPVPLHPRRACARGFNQADVLARQVGTRLNIPVNTHSVRRIRATKPQHILTMDARAANIANAFAPHPKAQLAGAHVLLVDDILTTGATASACTATLLQAGAHAVDLLTFASN